MEGLATHLIDVRRAEFYDRRTAITLSLDEQSIYVGKYWISINMRTVAVLDGSLEDFRRKAIQARLAQIDQINSASPPSSRSELAVRYERDDVLVRLLKELRGSACQICGATFQMASGESYSEAHHLEHLSNSGLDVSSNIILLCAQHHRQFHYGNVDILVHDVDHITIRIEEAVHTCRLR